MRLATCSYEGQDRIGIVRREDVLLLPATLGDMVDIIAGGEEALSRIREFAGVDAGVAAPRESVTLLPPIRRFSRDVLCTGWNYLDHFHESYGRREGQDVPLPGAPTFFTKSPYTAIGPYDAIAYDPKISAKWDYEAEVAVVFGKQGRSIAADDAMGYVWGYCLANDVSQRDLQRRHGAQWFKGKSMDLTMPLGPWITTADEVNAAAIRIQLFLNGTKMQDASTSQMAFSIPDLIAELTYGMTVRPGDVLLTGTPSGIGNARTPPVFLKAGDELVVAGSGLGELRNRLQTFDLLGTSSVKPVTAGD
jgi:2,4-didehydro-3-deoxy-L-rhamnonate hydrolase